ncbi:MAG: molybdenum cofactor guanylyltransferase [Anaerolineae bacterium]
MATEPPRFTLAINAGGKSSRMGTDKAFVRLAGKPMIEHVLSRTADLGQADTLIVTNRPDDYAVFKRPLVSDLVADKGALGGIYAALAHSRTPYTLVLACDMPFVSAPLLRYLIGLAAGDAYDLIVPRTAGYPEGLHAVYGQGCVEPIRRALEADQLKVTGFYSVVRVRYVDEAEVQPYDPRGLSFKNINTPEDLAQAEQIAAEP